MQLTGFTDVARRQWRVVAVAVLVCVGLALGITQLQGRRYSSSVRLQVSGSPATGASSPAPWDAAQRAAQFAKVVPQAEVVAAAVQGANAIYHANLANAHVSVHAGAHGGTLTITVRADDPDAALEVADAYPVVLPGQLARLHQAPAVADALLTITGQPTRASRPSAPRPLRNILTGLALGILLGLLAAGLRDRFDAGVPDVRQIARLVRGNRANLLAVVAREFDDEQVVVASRPQSRRAQGYREVRATLESVGAPRSVVVTGTGHGEGSSTLAANLALGYSQAGRRVTLVDAELRPPGLPAGADAAPSWPAKAELLRRLAADCDLLVVDAPPVRSGGEALRLAQLTDGLVLVIRPGRTSRHRLHRALRAIRQAPAILRGVVVNAAPPEQQPDPRPAEPAASRVPVSVTAQVDRQRADLLEQPSPTFTPPAPERRRAR